MMKIKSNTRPTKVKVELEMSENIKIAIEYWQTQGIRLNPCVSMETIEEYEQKLGIVFQEDYRQFLQIVNGFHEWSYDKDNFSFWSLELILEQNTQYSEPGYIQFADHLINCCTYYYSKKIGDNNIYEAPESGILADNFKEFLEMYLQECYQLIR